MRASQIGFNVVALLIAGFLIVSLLGILFLVMPNSDLDERGIWYFTMSVQGLMIATLGGGAVTNFAKGRLSSWATAIMIGGYCISIWLIPLAIWGALLLREELSRRRDLQQTVE